MHRTLIACLVLSSGLATIAHAQVHEDWVQTFNAGPTGIDEANAVAVARSGNVYAVGHTGTRDALILKYDPTGTLAWSRTVDLAGGIDIAYAVVIDPSDETVYAVGRADMQSTRGLVLKYDAAGSLLWSSVYHARSGTAQFSAAHLTPSGNLVGSGSLGQGGIFVVEYDPQGNVLWNTDVPGGDYTNDIAIDPFGDVIVCGPYDESAGTAKFGVAKLSATGSLLWTKVLSGGGAGIENANALETDASGAIYVAGRLFDSTNAPNGALVKLDPSGNVVWTRTSHGTAVNPNYGFESMRALAFAPNGNIRVGGITANSTTETDVQVFEYTTTGQLEWQGTWDGPASQADSFVAMSTEADGSLTVLARTERPVDLYDPAVLRWSARGNFLWADVDPLSASIDGYLYSGAFGPNGVRVFAGRTPSSLTITDVIVVQEREQAVSFCFGDGAGSLCPCGNGAAGRGCPNSANPNGAGLVASGDASLTNDTIALQGFGMLNGPALYYQGTTQVNAGQGSVFGDGLSCAGGSLIRLGTKTNVSGVSQYPVGGDASVSVKGAIASPGSRTYQVWYRNSASFCTSATFNLTNGVQITWNL